MCLECMRVLFDKLDKEVEDVNMDIKSYETCLQRLEGEAKPVLSETEFLKEKLKMLILRSYYIRRSFGYMNYMKHIAKFVCWFVFHLAVCSSCLLVLNLMMEIQCRSSFILLAHDL